MKTKIKILIGILVVGIILISGWWIWSFTHPEFCLTDLDCKYEKWERACVNKYNLLLKDLCDLINPYYYPPPPLTLESFYIEENIPCNCIDNKCVGDIEILCKGACEDWKALDCTSKPYATSEAEHAGIMARKVFFQMNCGEKINCECSDKQEVTITKEQAIAIASQTEEVKEFLKLYPDAKVDAMQHCCVETKVYGGECRCISSPDDNWVVSFYIDKTGWEFRYTSSVRVAINSKSGAILAKFPKLEYLKNKEYCEENNDCLCTGCCGGCANFIYKPLIEKQTEDILCYACSCNADNDCKCINNTCVATEEQQEVTITTDKTEYEQGEKINIGIRNNLNQNIYYMSRANKLLVKSCYRNTAETKIQRFKEGNWEDIKLYDFCCNVLCKPVGPVLKELKSSGSFFGFTWNQIAWKLEENWNASYKGEPTSPGKYRLVFVYYLSNKSKEPKYAYSNEFTIKEEK